MASSERGVLPNRGLAATAPTLRNAALTRAFVLWAETGCGPGPDFTGRPLSAPEVSAITTSPASPERAGSENCRIRAAVLGPGWSLRAEWPCGSTMANGRGLRLCGPVIVPRPLGQRVTEEPLNRWK